MRAIAVLLQCIQSFPTDNHWAGFCTQPGRMNVIWLSVLSFSFVRFVTLGPKKHRKLIPPPCQLGILIVMHGCVIERYICALDPNICAMIKAV